LLRSYLPWCNDTLFKGREWGVRVLESWLLVLLNPCPAASEGEGAKAKYPKGIKSERGMYLCSEERKRGV